MQLFFHNIFHKRIINCDLEISSCIINWTSLHMSSLSAPSPCSHTNLYPSPASRTPTNSMPNPSTTHEPVYTDPLPHPSSSSPSPHISTDSLSYSSSHVIPSCSSSSIFCTARIFVDLGSIGLSCSWLLISAWWNLGVGRIRSVLMHACIWFMLIHISFVWRDCWLPI